MIKNKKHKITTQYRDIPGYEGKYQVSSLGEIIRLSDRGEVKQKTIKGYSYGKGGNLYVGLCENGNRKRVRICDEVAKAFIRNPEGYKYVGRKDGDINNNKVENLFWTNKDNHRTTYRSKDTTRLFSFAEWYANKPNRKSKPIEEWYNEFIILNKK